MKLLIKRTSDIPLHLPTNLTEAKLMDGTKRHWSEKEAAKRHGSDVLATLGNFESHPSLNESSFGLTFPRPVMDIRGGRHAPPHSSPNAVPTQDETPEPLESPIEINDAPSNHLHGWHDLQAMAEAPPPFCTLAIHSSTSCRLFGRLRFGFCLVNVAFRMPFLAPPHQRLHVMVLSSCRSFSNISPQTWHWPPPGRQNSFPLLFPTAESPDPPISSEQESRLAYNSAMASYVITQTHISSEPVWRLMKQAKTKKENPTFLA